MYSFEKETDNLIITDVSTPVPWKNILTSETHYLEIDQCGQGKSFILEGKKRIPLRREKRFIYLRDDENGAVYSPFHVPGFSSIENFRCEHGPGHSSLRGQTDKITVSMDTHLPRDKGECIRLGVHNNDSRKRTVSLFIYMPLAWNDARTTNAFWDDDNGILLHFSPQTQHRMDTLEENMRKYPNWQAAAADCKPASWEASEYRFMGGSYRENAPAAVTSGACSCLPARGVPICAAMHWTFSLEPNESKQVHLYLDADADRNNATETVKKRASKEFFDASRRAVDEYWESLRNTYKISTPDPELDLLCNTWLKKQNLELCRFDRGNDVQITARNLMQDLLGWAMIEPDAAWKKFTAVLEHQSADGQLPRGWVPDSKIRGGGLNALNFRDGAVWLIFTGSILANWQHETVMDEPYPFDDDSKGTVYDHICRAYESMANDRGEHGLSLLGEGDWNDALTGPGRNGKGETLMLSSTLVYALKLFLPWVRQRRDSKREKEIETIIAELSSAVEEHGWKGDRYCRGYDDDGNPFGVETDKDAQVWLNAQTWPILAGIASPEHTRQAINIVEKRLEHPEGLALIDPVFQSPNPRLGTISVRNQGSRVNGSFYNHASTFAAAAACAAKAGDVAYRWLKKITPLNPENPPERNLQMPVWFSNYYFGPIDEPNRGVASMMSNTGTASWFLWEVMELFLGIRVTPDGILIDPAVPADWDSFEAERIIKGVPYSFAFKRTDEIQHNAVSLYVNGEKVAGTIVPFTNSRETVEIEVRLGCCST